MTRSRAYTQKEEAINALSHGFGILLGAFAGYLLLSSALKNESHWAVTGVIVYLFGMLSSYLSSTLYHSCTDERKKSVFRKFDHAAIYLHIAGTYTPFTLLIIHQEMTWGWVLFTFIWLAAIAGVYVSFRKLKKHSNIETICYVLMGCSILVVFKPLIDLLSVTGQLSALYWLIAGGVSYIAGALFYSWTKKPYMHTVFHFFTLGGSICHIIAIYRII